LQPSLKPEPEPKASKDLEPSAEAKPEPQQVGRRSQAETHAQA